MRLEYVVSVEGTVRTRPNESINKKMKTGSLEVLPSLLIQLKPHVFMRVVCWLH